MTNKLTRDTVRIGGGTALSGSLRAISSKSDLHRLIICAALADAPTSIRYSSALSKDITATIGCLQALGAEITSDAECIRVTRPIDRVNTPGNAVLFCNESGSTARFLLPLAALIAKPGTTLTGAGKLPERPFEDLCAALEQAGARFSSHKLPITVLRNAEPRDYFEISGNVSSQYLTGLLFLLPLCGAKGVRLTTTLESAGYVALTADAMKRFGVNVRRDGNIFTAQGAYHAADSVLDAQGDWSNAAFWLCAPRDDCRITVTGMDLTSSQPDRRVCEILTQMGMTLTYGADSVTAAAPHGTHGIAFDAREIPDLVPILSVRAAISEGETIITGIERLRIKESDRVSTVCDLITRLGGNIRAYEDRMVIHGVKTLAGGEADSFNDHRIAMSAAVAASFCAGDVALHGCHAVEKSYPLFFEHYKLLSDKDALSFS